MLLKTSALIAALAIGTAGHAATLVGSGTLSSANDLTVVSEGTTNFEFLDLTLTTDQTASAALAAYSSFGFNLATTTEINLLLGAFGLPLVPADAATSTGQILATTAGAVASFQSYLGITADNGDTFSIGVIDDETANGQSAIVNVRTFDGPSVFARGFNFGVGDDGAVDPEIGYYLVRSVDATPAVPLPASALLLLGAVGGLGALRRNRR